MDRLYYIITLIAIACLTFISIFFVFAGINMDFTKFSGFGIGSFGLIAGLCSLAFNLESSSPDIEHKALARVAAERLLHSSILLALAIGWKYFENAAISTNLRARVDIWAIFITRTFNIITFIILFQGMFFALMGISGLNNLLWEKQILEKPNHWTIHRLWKRPNNEDDKS